MRSGVLYLVGMCCEDLRTWLFGRAGVVPGKLPRDRDRRADYRHAPHTPPPRMDRLAGLSIRCEGDIYGAVYQPAPSRALSLSLSLVPDPVPGPVFNFEETRPRRPKRCLNRIGF